MKQLIAQLREQLVGIDSVLLYYAEGIALLNYIEKLEAAFTIAESFLEGDELLMHQYYQLKDDSTEVEQVEFDRKSGDRRRALEALHAHKGDGKCSQQ